MKQEDLFNLGRKMVLDDGAYTRIQTKIKLNKKITSNNPKSYQKLALAALSYLFCVTFIFVIIAGVRTVKEPPISPEGEFGTSDPYSGVVSSVSNDVSSKTESIIEVSRPTEESKTEVSEPDEDEIDRFFKKYGTVENYYKTNPIYEYQNEATYPIYINKTHYNEKERTEQIYILLSKLDISEEVEIDNFEIYDLTYGYVEQKKISIDFKSYGAYSIDFRYVNEKDTFIESDCINQTKNYIKILKGDLEALNYKVEQDDYALTIYVYCNSTDIIDKYPLFRFRYFISGWIYIDCYRDNSEFYNKFSIKTMKEAEDSLLAGNYFNAMGEKIPPKTEYKIIACDLQYTTSDCKFIQPYYVFLIDLNPGATKSYISHFYVQAIKDEYIKSEKINIEYHIQ